MQLALPSPAPGSKIMHAAKKMGDSHFWKRLGVAGFAFFLLKGLAWLIVPVVAYLFGAPY
jgi:hypothetical protein